MSQYRTGTVSVTNGSASVTGVGTDFAANAVVGNLFTIQGENVWYEVLSAPSAGTLTLKTPYVGTTKATREFILLRDFTPNLKLPYLTYGDIQSQNVIQLALAQIDATLTSLDGSGTVESVFRVQRTLTGAPTSDAGIVIERGTQPDASILFRDSQVTKRWEFAGFNVGAIGQLAAASLVITGAITGASYNGYTPLDSATYTAADILTKVKTVDGLNSGLDADRMQGYNLASAATASTLALRDGTGKLAGDILGNAATATKLLTTRAIAISGDGTGTINFDGSAAVSIPFTLATVSAGGTFPKVTYNTKGLVTGGAALVASDIPSLTTAKLTDFDTAVRAYRLDQFALPSANIPFSNVRLTNVADPTSAQDVATKNYVDALKQGLDLKDSVRVATTANITLSGVQTIDGVSVLAGDRVLVKDQTTASQNGIYYMASGAWTRAIDADVSSKISAGMYAFVEEGTVNGDTGWVLATNGTINLGTTALAFTQFSSAAVVSAGTGLTKSGTVLSITGASSITTGAITKWDGIKFVDATAGTDYATPAGVTTAVTAGINALKAAGATFNGPISISYGTPILDVVDSSGTNQDVRILMRRASRYDDILSNGSGLALRYNTSGVMKTMLFDGTDLKVNANNVWHASNFDPATKLAVASNLSDLADKAAAVSSLKRPVQTKTSAYVIAATDIASTILLNGTFTMSAVTAASLGNGFSVRLRNIGTGLVTFYPNSSETVNGKPTLLLPPGQECTLISDGANLHATGLKSRILLSTVVATNTTSALTFTMPDGFDAFELRGGGLRPNADGDYFYMRFSTDGGASYSNGNHAFSQVFATGGPAGLGQSSSGSASFCQLTAPIGNAATLASFTCRIDPGEGSPSGRAPATKSTSYSQTNDSYFWWCDTEAQAYMMQGLRATNLLVGLVLGNIQLGRFSLYGLTG